MKTSYRKKIIEEIEKLPEVYLKEILDFIEFLQKKVISQKMELTILSESSLEKDWLSPVEDEAWKDL